MSKLIKKTIEIEYNEDGTEKSNTEVNVYFSKVHSKQYDFTLKIDSDCAFIKAEDSSEDISLLKRHLRNTK